MTEELRVRKIKDGTVLDHIAAGNALAVLRILGISGREENVVSILINVPSKRLKKKDVVKIEGREISPMEVDEIALIAPHATINIIRDFKLVNKKKVRLPRIVKEIIKCPRSACITNSREPVKPVFCIDSEDPLLLRCYYCEYVMEKEDIIQQFSSKHYENLISPTKK
ncbi:MAG: aspartate carbamoyltransferase regulatory subunit [Candidatus Bathyarchaeota archaeon]